MELFGGLEEPEQLLAYFRRHLVAHVHAAKGAPESRTHPRGGIEYAVEEAIEGGQPSSVAGIVIGRGTLRQRDEQSCSRSAAPSGRDIRWPMNSQEVLEGSSSDQAGDRPGDPLAAPRGVPVGFHGEGANFPSMRRQAPRA